VFFDSADKSVNCAVFSENAYLDTRVDGLTGIVGNNVRLMHQILSGDDEVIEAIKFHVNKKAKCLDTPIKDLKLKKKF
jgi:hypothetical protein